ncbi:MAG: FtsQ-type POTRA domain-containing protein [Alphaproteobacteria bacterium]|nr:FtsQ-type POTRA domain-containing protein [Alphaproteobacteria bacterium]
MVADNKVYEEVLWPYRLIGNLLLLGSIWLLTMGIITLRHDLVGKQIDSLLAEIYNKTANAGWGLDDITIEGRFKTSKEDILEVMRLQRGDNILEIDLDEICRRLEDLPWIKKVSVTRRYFPNVIHISITEKEVKSIWQYQNEFYPIDEEGEIIKTEYVPQANILQIIGEDAPKHFNALLKIVETEPELFARLKAAHLISKRRWNLIFDDVEKGVTVKMPEENLAGMWKKLAKLDKTQGILKRKLTFIDLRLKNKVVVGLSKSDTEKKVKH